MFNKSSKNTNLGSTKQPSSLTFLSVREKGIFSILVGVGAAFPGFYMPYCDILEKKESFYWHPAMSFCSILFTLLGLVLFVLGNHYADIIKLYGYGKKKNLFTWIHIIISWTCIVSIFVVSYVGMFLFRKYLSSFGYTF